MTPEHDEHDEYLWTGAGPVTLEVARVEQPLRSLAWRPRELPLPAAAADGPARVEAVAVAVAVNPAQVRAHEPRTSPRRASPWLAPLAAGLLAAAAVLAVVIAQRSDDSATAPGATEALEAPAAEPAGRPQAPQLRDPFAGAAPTPPPPTPAPDPSELQDPFSSSAPSVPPSRPRSPGERDPSLLDPFGSTPTGPKPPPTPAPPPPPDREPDLVDPFKGERDAPAKPGDIGELSDPFRAKPPQPAPPKSPDLSDPFAR